MLLSQALYSRGHTAVFLQLGLHSSSSYPGLTVVGRWDRADEDVKEEGETGTAGVMIPQGEAASERWPHGVQSGNHAWPSPPGTSLSHYPLRT